MRLLRAAWVVLAILVLGLDAAGIPYAYARYKGVCTRAPEVCFEDGLLTPESVRELGEFGLSPTFYAAYQGVGLETAFTLVCFAVAAVIFWRRSDERMALFTSFVLLIFGGAGAAGTMRDLAEAQPVFWFPVTLLDYASQVCFGIFFTFSQTADSGHVGRDGPPSRRRCSSCPSGSSRTLRWPACSASCSTCSWQAWWSPRSIAIGGSLRRSNVGRPSGWSSGSLRRW